MAQISLTVRQDRWEEIIRLLLAGEAILLDHLHVTAILEKNGWTDRRASEEFGFDDLFAMADELFRQLQSRVLGPTLPGEDPYPWYRWLGMGSIYFLRGLLFAMPMIISVVAMLLLRYSLWSYIDFDTERATGIAIGTIASFLVTGGFGQAIARRGLFYISMNEFTLSRRTSLRFMATGMVVSIVLGATVLILNLLFPFFSWRLLTYAAPYYLFLCLLWLTITVLYMMQREVLFTAITAAGIATVWFFYGYRQILPIDQAQMVGLGLSTAISLIVAIWLFRQAERRQDARPSDVALPRWSQVSLALMPFFLFGIVYFAFLFIDRVMAWSVPSDVHPYPIWFLGDYELGLDWAILTLITPMGILELLINLFSKRVEYWLPRTRGVHWDRLNNRFRTAYRWQMAILALISAISGLIIYILIVKYNVFNIFNQQLVSSPVTKYVFALGTIAYVFVAIGLLNCLTLFSLNIPWPGVRAIAWSLLVNALVGFIASRLIGYPHAVLGLLLGSILFAFLTTFDVHQRLSQLDFVLYQAQ